MKPYITVLIPARMGSVRCKNKNFRPFCNNRSGDVIHLTDLAIAAARELPGVGRIIVSTDQADPNKYNQLNLGDPRVEILKRPDELCTSEASSELVMLHALGEDIGAKLFLVLQPTSPFRTESTLRSMVSGFRLKEDGTFAYTSRFESRLVDANPRQLANSDIPNGNVYGFRKTFLDDLRIRASGHRPGHLMSWHSTAHDLRSVQPHHPAENLDIDTEDQFEMASVLARDEGFAWKFLGF